jgi:multidrug efflux pump subunit AcrA (membrane-fusion protein)
MMKKSVMIVVLALALIAVAAGGWVFGRPAEVATLIPLALPDLIKVETAPTTLTVSGFIEANPVTVSAEVPGRIARLEVDEGDPVAQGQVLAEIGADLLNAQIAEAEASLAVAKAKSIRVQTGARTQDIAVAEAAVAIAEAQRDAAYRAWQDAIALRDNPQELDLQIAAARSQLDVAQHRIEQLVPLKDAAELMNGLRERQADIAEEGTNYHFSVPGYGSFSGHYNFPEGEERQAWAGWNLVTTDLWSAWVNLNQAVAARDATQQSLNDLLAMRNNPQQTQVEVSQAETAYQQAVAGVEVAKARLDKIRVGASQEQIEVARSGVEQARAALDALQVQRQKHTLRAPITGLVTEQVAHEGEMALPGTPLLTLADLDTVDLTIYVPEIDVGKVFLGQQVAVMVDAFPAKMSVGQVVWISDQAEFTPKNIQTQEERVNTVFAVKVRISNPDHKLKPGKAADAVLVIG